MRPLEGVSGSETGGDMGRRVCSAVLAESCTTLILSGGSDDVHLITRRHFTPFATPYSSYNQRQTDLTSELPWVTPTPSGEKKNCWNQIHPARKRRLTGPRDTVVGSGG
ncbi:unnamed protein product [Zymoseptoria tritici ST99CH_3D1]|nr:unnamed protein product [Zymoseptoria tritici ST99CH_3D1]